MENEIQKFYKFTETAMIDTFSINKKLVCEVLTRWLDVEGTLNEFENTTINNALQRFQKLSAGWNEEELKMKFLAFLFYYAEIDEPEKIKLFYERPLSAILDSYKINVKCDCLIAKPKGIGKPTHPYFFLQEFKKQKQQEDAEGQMLAAMLIAQHLNADNKPVYGAFLQGKFWTFTVLHQKDYCVSSTYDASDKKELLEILFILKHLKIIILNQYQELI